MKPTNWICNGCGVDTWSKDGVALISIHIRGKTYCLQCGKPLCKRPRAKSERVKVS